MTISRRGKLYQSPRRLASPLSLMFALIRHAGYHLGNGSLTPDGAEAVNELGAVLQGLGPWTELRCSPSTRTQETAVILSGLLNIPMTTDERIGMDGDLSDLLPPTEPNGIIFISHLPVLSRWLRSWSRVFGQEEPPITEIGCGYLIDTEAKTMRPVGPLPKSSK
jgi:phosphohistidine phosphatase SixA